MTNSEHCVLSNDSRLVDQPYLPVVPQAGLYINNYTVYHQTGQRGRSFAALLCDHCVDLRRVNNTIGAKWTGESTNAFCNDCGAGPSVAHFRFATTEDLAAITRGEIVYVCGNGQASGYRHADTVRALSTEPSKPSGQQQRWVTTQSSAEDRQALWNTYD